jgi:exodeoxyribonuclease VII large subunit
MHRHSERTDSRAARVAVQVRRQLDAAAVSVDRRALRLGPLALMTVERQEERLGALRRLLGAYDVERQLERGYTLTLDAGGRLVRSASALEAGETLVTRFADGTVRSTVGQTNPHVPATDQPS